MDKNGSLYHHHQSVRGEDSKSRLIGLYQHVAMKNAERSLIETKIDMRKTMEMQIRSNGVGTMSMQEAIFHSGWPCLKTQQQTSKEKMISWTTRSKIRSSVSSSFQENSR